MRLDAPGTVLLRIWSRLSPRPGGRWLFGRLLGWMVPYSGSLGARVEHLSPGHAEVRLRDRRGVRNHLGSIHAIALANLGELCSGLAVLTALPPEVKGIVVTIHAEYTRKARGEVFASARFVPPEIDEEATTDIRVRLRDASGNEVAVVTATWNLRPVTDPS